MATNDELKSNAEKIMADIEAKLYDKLKNDSPVDKLREQITVGDVIIKSSGKKTVKVQVPAKIINAFAAPVVEKIDAKSVGKYTKNKWVQKVLEQIISAVIPIEPVEGNDFRIIYDPLDVTIYSTGKISAKITWGKYESTLTWENFSQDTLKDYFDTLKQLDKDLWKNFAEKLIGETAKVIKAIYGGQDNLLKEVFGSKILKVVSKDKIKSEFKKYLKKFTSDDKELLQGLSDYENLSANYNSLVKALNKNSGIESNAKNFLETANALENKLGLTISTLSENYSYNLTYKNKNTTVIIPAFYGKELKPDAYKSSVKNFDASGRTTAIKITGNSSANLIVGGTGNDTLDGGKGKDILYGGAGKDSLFGGSSNDKLYGKDGNDTLRGGTGNDTLDGGKGKDILYGGAGKDSLFGGSSSDKLYGEDGNDTLIGGTGNDTLSGGNGADIFYYSNGDGNDVIADFTAGDDKIYLASGSIGKVTMSGKNATFKIGKGSIKVQKAKGKEITIIDADNVERKYLNGKLVSIAMPSDAFIYNGHAYKLFNNGMTWKEAKNYCKSLGGHLVTITDENEQTVIENLVDNDLKNAYWIGCKLNSSNKMAWITNEKMDYSNWSDGQPDNYQGNQGYGLIIGKNYEDQVFGKWGDLQNDCSSWDGYHFWGLENFGFICEWDNGGDLDSLINALPTANNNSVAEFVTEDNNNPNKLLSNVAFTQTEEISRKS